jgi:hypothetical protein
MSNPTLSAYQESVLLVREDEGPIEWEHENLKL